MDVLSPRNNNTYEKNEETDHVIKTSPKLPTVRRVGAGHKTKTNQWQDFIDREQNSVDYLIQNSFATLRKGELNRLFTFSYYCWFKFSFEMTMGLL